MPSSSASPASTGLTDGFVIITAPRAVLRINARRAPAMRCTGLLDRGYDGTCDSYAVRRPRVPTKYLWRAASSRKIAFPDAATETYYRIRRFLRKGQAGSRLASRHQDGTAGYRPELLPAYPSWLRIRPNDIPSRYRQLSPRRGDRYRALAGGGFSRNLSRGAPRGSHARGNYWMSEMCLTR